jgi:hypothetical protein
LPPALLEGFTIVTAGRTPPLAPNLFVPVVTAEMSDCGGGGVSETPGMAVEGAAESCVSISGGVGASGEVGGQEQRKAGIDGVEAGICL